MTCRGLGWHEDSEIVATAFHHFGGMEAKLEYIPPSAAAGNGKKVEDKDLKGTLVPNDLLAFNARPSLTIGALDGDGRVDLGAGKLTVLKATVPSLKPK